MLSSIWSTLSPDADLGMPLRQGLALSGASLLFALSTGAEAAGAQSKAAGSTAAIAAAATPATVTILAIAADGDTISQGSGFFVSASGVLVTNWHVLRGAARAIVVRTEGPKYERVAFIAGDSAIDLAVLKVPGYGLPFLPMRSTTPKVGESVTVIGSPLGFASTVTTGIVSALRTERGRDAVQISASVSPGSSGGAVLDATGKVFAVASWRVRGGEQMNFAIPLRYASGWISGPLAERSVASVFAGALISDARRQVVGAPAARTPDREPTPARGAPAAALFWGPMAIPRRVSDSPDAALQGVFTFDTEIFYDSLDYRARRSGILIMDEILDGIGWIVLTSWRATPRDTTNDALEIYQIRSVRRTSDGRIVLDAGGNAYTGYRTAKGYFLASSGRDRDGDHYLLRMVAAQETPKPSDNLGLYDATWVTTWIDTAGTRATTRVAWAGSVAALTANDSIYISFALTNDKGGSAGTGGRGPIDKDGVFALESKDGSFVKGTLRAGLLVADYFDVRDGGGFIGKLRGTRR